MKFEQIKQHNTLLDREQCIQIKGGTNDSSTSSQVIIEDVDVI